MNTYIHNGILYSTDKKYLRIDISDRNWVREDDRLDLLYVSIEMGLSAEEFVNLHPQFTVVRNLDQTVPLDPTNIIIPHYSLDGLIIKPRVHKYRVTQVITSGISYSLTMMRGLSL